MHLGQAGQGEEQEDGGHGEPGVTLVKMNVAVAVNADDRGQGRDEKNASGDRDSATAQMGQDLGCDEHADCRPPDTGQHVEQGHDLGAGPTKGESGDGHLAQAEPGSERRKKSGRDRAEGGEEDHTEGPRPKTQMKNRAGECAQGHRGNHQIGREPKREVVENVEMVPFVRRNPFDAALFDPLGQAPDGCERVDGPGSGAIWGIFHGQGIVAERRRGMLVPSGEPGRFVIRLHLQLLATPI